MDRPRTKGDIMTSSERIPLHVDVKRVVEVLASQIYQTPLAMLRENAQNAFDAVLLRRAMPQSFDPRITISISQDQISVHDNGIGMTRDELRDNYWRAGASGKNTAAARAAGVVGTFGIGAMANFGIARDLTVETESAKTRERTRCYAVRENLSATDDCIDIQPLTSTGVPGTLVTARMAADIAINVRQAEEYIAQFVRYLTIPVIVNDTVVSQQGLGSELEPPEGWHYRTDPEPLGPPLGGELTVGVSSTGQVWCRVSRIEQGPDHPRGRVVVRQGLNGIDTMRSGFGLARAVVSSDYQWGGMADLLGLQPTAGREALDTGSLQLLQTLFTHVDRRVSEFLGGRPESDSNLAFMNWVVRHRRWDLCRHVKIRTVTDVTDDMVSLGSLCDEGGQSHHFYRGSDPGIISDVASAEQPLLVVSARRPRHQCQLSYLNERCSAMEVSNRPRVTGERRPAELWSFSESALAFRIVNVLAADYFLDVSVDFAGISHGLAILVERSTTPVQLVLDPEASHVRNLLELYATDYAAFGAMVKDYVRSVIFPKIQDLVPSSRKAGAEAFLRVIRAKRERVEYEAADLESLTEVWRAFIAGRMSMADAARRTNRLERRSVQVVSPSSTASVSQVVPDVLENERSLHDWHLLSAETTLEPLPPVMRREIPCDAKVLTISGEETAVRGYRLFVAIADGIRRDRGEFFLQAHRTTVVWGGQKVLFIFEHHSGRFGLYYDVLMPEMIDVDAGGGRVPSSTIVLRDRMYIPIPNQLLGAFIPAEGQTKRFEVAADLIHVEDDDD